MDELLHTMRRRTQVALDALRATTDPFTGILEAPEPVVELFQEHARPLREARAAYEERLRALEAAIDAVRPEGPGAT